MTPSSDQAIGIIAGSGQLPALLINACRDQKRSYKVIGLTGAADTRALGESPALWMRLGDVAKGFDYLHNNGVHEVVMAGHVRRPTLAELMPDWRTAKFLARIGTRAFLDREAIGDDKLLRVIIEEIEQEGFSVIGVDTVLSDLLVDQGVLGTKHPTEQDFESIKFGIAAAQDLGRKDRGQAVVVQNTEILAVEDSDGTDVLIAKAGRLKGTERPPILIKVCKPQQDRRADLPAIGVHTVSACREAGLGGIAIEANGTLVIDKDEVVNRANAASIFVVSVNVGISSS